jgi:CBS-domain-containing membrane protein
MIIRDCMKNQVITLPHTATTLDAVRLCTRHHIGTLPVIDEKRRLLGLIRLQDLINLAMPDFVQLLDEIDFVRDFGAMEHHQPEAAILEQPANLFMTPPVSVEETTGLLCALALLHKHQISDLPVVDIENRLLGIASHVDIGIALMSSWNVIADLD